MRTDTLCAEVEAAVSAVSDPEFPGVSIAELGMVERVSVEGTTARVELVPTFLGCPALDTIRRDVAASVAAVAGIDRVEVEFVDGPVWTPVRVTAAGRRKLADGFTVAVRSEQKIICPVCGSGRVEERSAFGPTACRAVAYCEDCRNPVEVMRQ